MIMKYKDLGAMLTSDEMKNINGGVAWNQLRDFKCLMHDGTLNNGGCTSVSGCASAWCRNTYGYGFSSVEWGAWGCPYDTIGCGSV